MVCTGAAESASALVNSSTQHHAASRAGIGLDLVNPVRDASLPLPIRSIYEEIGTDIPTSLWQASGLIGQEPIIRHGPLGEASGGSPHARGSSHSQRSGIGGGVEGAGVNMRGNVGVGGGGGHPRTAEDMLEMLDNLSVASLGGSLGGRRAYRSGRDATAFFYDQETAQRRADDADDSGKTTPLSSQSSVRSKVSQSRSSGSGGGGSNSGRVSRKVRKSAKRDPAP